MLDRKTWRVRASDIATHTHNPIRAIVDGLQLEPNPDKPMIALSIGDPTVFGNLKPPQEVLDAIVESVSSGKYNGYTTSIGYLEARTAVAEYSSTDQLKVDPKDVILCSGCSCSIDMCITVLANPGENILVPKPGFSIYRTLAEGLGIRVKSYKLKPETGWEIDLEDLESQIDRETMAIVINNPSNPCGSVFSKKHLEDILQIASRNCVPIIADEIYEHMVFPGEEFHSLGSLSKDVPILSCSGLTKRFLIPGWRMGWIVIHDKNNILDKEVRKGLHCLSQRIIGSSTIVQGAIPRILQNTPKEFYWETVETLEKHARLAFRMLSEIQGLTPVMPKGAMYMMVGIDMSKFPNFRNELEFVERMVTEESVFCLPGECFDFPNYMRLVLTAPEDMIEEACGRISEYCERHYRSQTEQKTGENILSTFREEVSADDIPCCDNTGRKP